MPSEPTTSDRSAWLPAARERHGAALHRYATHLLGRDAARAQAVVQEVFARLAELPEDEVEEDLTEWVFEECRHRAIAAAGGESRLGRAVADGAGAAEGEPPHATMQRLIDRLTPKQQEAVRLRFQNGFSFKTIARITDLSPANVGVLIHHAMARLAQEFAEVQPDAAANVPAGGHDDPRLTTFALGEMEEAERKSFEEGLFDRKAAHARVEATRAVGNQIGQALAIEAGAPAPRTVRRRKRRGLGGIVWLAAGVCVLGGAGAFWFWTRTPPEKSPADAERIDFRLQPSKWNETPRATEPEASPVAHPADRVMADRGELSLDAPRRTERSHSPQTLAAREQAASADNRTGKPPESAQQPRGTGPVSPGVAARLRGQRGEVTQNAKPAHGANETAVAPVAEVHEDDHAVTGADAVDSRKAFTGAAAGEAGAVHRLEAETRNGGKEVAGEKTPGRSPGSVPPLDTETTSAVILRRALMNGQLPPRGAVKVAELVNYFPYHYAAPAPATEAFSAAVEATEMPWAPGKRLVRIGLKARESLPVARPAALVVVLLDVSASMDAPNRLPLAKEAVRRLLGRLRPEDRVGIVTYAGESRLTLDPQPVSATQKILAALDRLEARGQTNGSAGLELAYDLARAQRNWSGTKQVILCTDGGFNLGAVATDQLAQLVDRWADSGVRLSVFGFGRTERIDTRLETLAVQGRGASGYVNTRRDAERALIGQVDGLLQPVAADVQVEVAFNPAKVRSYRLVGFEGAGESVVVNGEHRSVSKTAGVVLPGHAMTALYEIVPASGSLQVAEEGTQLLDLTARYTDPVTGLEQRQKFTMPDRAVEFARASEDFRFAAAVAAFGLFLREPGGAGGPNLDDIAAWGRSCLTDDRGGYRQEFLTMVARAKAARR